MNLLPYLNRKSKCFLIYLYFLLPRGRKSLKKNITLKEYIQTSEHKQSLSLMFFFFICVKSNSFLFFVFTNLDTILLFNINFNCHFPQTIQIELFFFWTTNQALIL